MLPRGPTIIPLHTAPSRWLAGLGEESGQHARGERGTSGEWPDEKRRRRKSRRTSFFFFLCFLPALFFFFFEHGMGQMQVLS